MNSMKFFTSDLHFFHRKICSFTNRPWDQEDNEERLISLWNDQVGKGDLVYHLGDMFFLKNNEPETQIALEVIERLNGNIFFILGNHDSSAMFNNLKERTNKIVGVERMKEIKIGSGKRKKSVVLCHYPLMSWNRSHYGTFQLFGHHHGSIHHPGRAVDVGLDGAIERLGEHRFWTEEDVIGYMKGREIWTPGGDHHKMKED